jgi:uncharacterized membrane protein YwaF
MPIIDLIATLLVAILDAFAAIPALGWAVLIVTIAYAVLHK